MTLNTNSLRSLLTPPVNSNRIPWIDIAKGITILLVIIGHTVQTGGWVRNFIFSFHMPLFFILSGYTFHTAKTKNELGAHLRKNIRHLLLPCLLVSVISVLWQWHLTPHTDMSTLYAISKRMADALWYGSGVKVHAHPAAGAIWFIISLFWAKLIIDIVSLLFRTPKIGYLFTFLGIIGMVAGIRDKWMVQNFDVTLVAVFFIYIGMLWRANESIIQKWEAPFFALSVSLWTAALSYGIYIELASRHYPYTSVSVIEALAGTFAVCMLCKTLSENHITSEIFTFLGKHTLSIFFVHHLDWILRAYWGGHPIYINCTLRVLYVVVIALLFSLIWETLQRYRIRLFR